MLITEPGTPRLSFSARRTAAIATLAIAAFASSSAAHAQQAVSAEPAAAPAAPATLFAATSTEPIDFAALAGAKYISSASSSMDAVNSSAAESLALPADPGDALQPPPRRRYGRPRYNDSSHNPDGSNKYAFIAGAGLTLPTGNTYHYDTTSYGFQVGGGRNFNKNFAVLLQYDFDRFGLNGATLANQTTVYNYEAPAQYQISGLDGNAHVWSFSLNPVYTIYSGEGLGAYVVAGVGFYHKVTNFTLPETGVGFDPYYGEYEYTANETIDHYTSNAPGFNGGFGLTYKPSRFANERLYVEARYVFVANQQRTGQSVNNINDVNTYNQYPANSNRTTYIPIKAGIRF